MMKPTIYEALVEKLGRHPTRVEIKAEVQRILEEVHLARAEQGKLRHQRRLQCEAPKLQSKRGNRKMENVNREARENVARCRAFIVQAIVTKYIGPSNFRGSRIKATAAAGSVIVSVDHRLNSEENHTAAAMALADKFGWGGVWFQGGMPNDSGYVFVCAARTEQDLATTAATFVSLQKQV